MPINMQGAWTVSVSFREAGSSSQRFTISGAASGNGTYVVERSTQPVTAHGPAWVITVENNPGTGWRTSFDQISLPVRSGEEYRFDIQANQDDADPIFDDLILTCSTPVTLFDYLIYGNASRYNDECIFNPGSATFLVIETRSALVRALRNCTLRTAIEALYPDQRKELSAGVVSDFKPFKKIVIPLRDQTPIPTQIAQVFNTNAAVIEHGMSPSAAASFSSTRAATRTVGSAVVAVNRINQMAVSGLVDHLSRKCQTVALPRQMLRFLRYDRTSTELAGGPYTGMGARELLGSCATDRNGNYVFRFQRSLMKFHESELGVAHSDGFFTAILPDVIAQMLDPSRPGGFCYESAPFWNIPFFESASICAPEGRVRHLYPARSDLNGAQSTASFLGSAPATTADRAPGYRSRSIS